MTMTFSYEVVGEIADLIGIISEDDIGYEFFNLDPDLYLDCADLRDIELVLEFFGCIDADV